MQRKIFREAALERLSSPEQLDQLMQVTSLRGWLALLALIGLIVTVAGWSVSDSIPTEVVGRGILLRGGRLLSVAAPAAGQVEAVLVRPGDTLQAGQALARVRAGSLAASDAPSVEVTSPYAGQVVSLDITEGSVVSAGMTVASVEDSASPLEAVIYMPPEQGKNVREGMAVQISPSNIGREEYGFIRGRVRSVAAYPSTFQSMLLVVGNEQLVTEFLRGGTPIEIHIDLETDPTTPSGFRWSSSSGPPTPIGSGSLASATVTLDEQRPIEFVLPIR